MKESIFSKINKTLGKLSKTTLILLLILYSAVLGGIYALVTVTSSYLVIPTYEHVYWDEAVNPQITIIGRRTFDDNNKMTLKYSVNVSTYGRISSTSTADPGYSLTDFRMSASTVSSITSKIPDNMYYFTEYKTYSTPTTHYFTIDNSSVEQHPYTIYTMIQYKKGGKSSISTYKEDIFLYPTVEDINKINEYYSSAEASNATSRNIKSSSGAQIANIQFIASEQSDYYSSGVKITMEKLGYEYRHHIDMQSWIVTSEGKYLPFIGVYSYSQQKTNFTSSGIQVYKKLNPEYIISKLRYYYSEDNYVDYYFKQEFSKLPSSFQSAPSAYDEEIEENSSKLTTTLIIAMVVLFVQIAILIAWFVYYRKNIKKTEEKNTPKYVEPSTYFTKEALKVFNEDKESNKKTK